MIRLLKQFKLKRCDECQTLWFLKAMVLNKKTGKYFCPKCVSMQALKMAWKNEQDITLIQAQLDAKNKTKEKNDG